MKKRIVVLSALVAAMCLCVSGCGSKKVDLTKADGVLEYRQNKSDKKKYEYVIDVHELINVTYEQGNGCGTYKIDTTELEKFILNRTDLVEGSAQYESLRESIQSSFSGSAVNVKNSDSSKCYGYLSNGDVIKLQFKNVYIPSERILKYSNIVFDEDSKAKEYTVNGLGKITDEVLWEGVGYEFKESWSSWYIRMVVDNDCNSVEYKWDIEDTYDVENGDTFEITATIGDEIVGKKTFKVEGKPKDEE